ncbi:hypothetical protein A9490_00145 [Bacillus thuringiensis]|uniref:hypothetical protein n=1 Tax=Bacillus thuringiensis TaxID=1428 RepID=UPI0008FE89B8|nr:hypothetical protein [Bacillus thuringiensis]OJE29624.1 hypothetical protein A9490_00145 [Bacillus thuringiensis]
MIHKNTLNKLLMCVGMVLSLFVRVGPVFADGPSIQLLGSKGVTVDNKGISLSLKVTDAKDIVTFQLSELMLVNDCSFNFGLTKWVRPSQKENQFDISIKENGTYAFYIFSNGKVKGYVRFKAKGFPQNAQGGGVTQYWGEGAKYYELPEEAVNPDDYRDYDGKNDGICTNEKLPDKPHGSGDIEEPKEDDKGNGNNNNGGSNKDLQDIKDKFNEISNKIPPVPDWEKVADTFADKISPKLTKDIKDMLGEASDPPKPPPQIPKTDNKGLDGRQPEFKENPDLEKAKFTKDDIKDGAPEIKFEEDKSGGFDIKDPMDNLPDLPDEMPKPGETTPSDWGKNKPKEPEPQEKPVPKDKEKPKDPPKPKPDEIKPPKPNEGDSGFPKPKEDGGKPPKPKEDVGKPPKPNEEGSKPPKPNDSGDKPPKPNTNLDPPIPNNPSGSFGNYKRHPEDPDGSG